MMLDFLRNLKNNLLKSNLNSLGTLKISKLSSEENIHQDVDCSTIPDPQTPCPEYLFIRREIAGRYIQGQGVEIGALHSPLEVPSGVKVHYLDRMSVDELRKQYPELSAVSLVEVDIVDDGETLQSISDHSLDFVIANHIIEHCQDPITTMKNYLRVLKDDGIVYMAVPDKRYTFDSDRPVTELAHLIRDYTEGPEWSNRFHFEEYVRLVDKVPPQTVPHHSQYLMDLNYSIHFHVWTPMDFLELLVYCHKQLGFNWGIEQFQTNGMEFIFILKKLKS